MEETETEENAPDRKGWQKLMPWAALVVMVVVPVTLAATLPSSTVTAILLAYLPASAFTLSLADAFVYRPAVSYPLLIGFFFLVSTWIFYSSGGWIYAVGLTIVAFAGNAIGETVLERREAR